MVDASKSLMVTKRHILVASPFTFLMPISPTRLSENHCCQNSGCSRWN